MAFKPIDPKRDEFRRYLERAGVIESLTKVFAHIVRERPENPLEYLRDNLGDSLQQADKVAYLNNELKEAHREIQRLREIIQTISPEVLKEDAFEETANVTAALAQIQVTDETQEQVTDNNKCDENGTTTAAPVMEQVEEVEFANKESLEENMQQNDEITAADSNNIPSITQSVENKVE